MIDQNIFQLDEFQSEDLCEEYNEKAKKRNDEAYLNNKNINVNKKTSLNSRLSHELKTIVGGQHERECFIQKRIQSIEDDSEPSVKRIKSSSPSKIEEIIERINNKLNDMHKNVDMIMDIRNSILCDI